MKFYSRENGRDGEKDYIDTDDFKDVYFEKDEFTYINNGTSINSKISYALNYIADEVSLVGTTVIDNKTYSDSIVIDPVTLTEQGAMAYYNEELLDDIVIIKGAKTQIANNLKQIALDNGMLLRGTSLDVLGLIVNGGNTIATLDDIVIIDERRIKASKNYAIVNLAAVTAGTLTIHLSDDRVLVGELDRIEIENQEVTVVLSSSEVKANEEPVNYKKSSTFKDIEDYYADRAIYISIGTEPEAEFDEFDDLF